MNTWPDERLVKAAPAMLVALERARRFMANVPTDEQLDAPMLRYNGDTGRAIWASIVDAIAKAKGTA